MIRREDKEGKERRRMEYKFISEEEAVAAEHLGRYADTCRYLPLDWIPLLWNLLAVSQ